MNPLVPLSPQDGDTRETADPDEIDKMVQDNERQAQQKAARQQSGRPSGRSGAALQKEVKRLMRKFPTPETALLAASWGEEATERWMKSGGDPSKIPEKDKQFVSEMLPKIQQGMDEPVESRRVSQDPEDETPSRRKADMARQKAREEMLAASVSQGAAERSVAMEAARGQLEQVRRRRANQATSTPEVQRQAPDSR